MRDSGLGHLLSVSGIHMGVVGGLVFAAVLWTLSLIAPIALRFPVKKIAAVGALLVLAAYLVVSGSSVPALRSFVMACVAFGAILLDRPAISMRGLALAAFDRRADLPGIRARARLPDVVRRDHGAGRAVRNAEARAARTGAADARAADRRAATRRRAASAACCSISFVAGLATDPFAIYHFQRFSLYALPANLIAAPIMSFLVAPAGGVAAVLAPFGLADPALELMASALDLIAAVGQTFGERPEAVRALPQPPDLAFVLCVFALLWACLWRGALRWAAAPIFVASVALYVTAPRPSSRSMAICAPSTPATTMRRWTPDRSARPLHLRARPARRDARPFAAADRTPRAAGERAARRCARGGARTRDFAFARAEEGVRRCVRGAAIVAARRPRPAGLR